MDASGAAHPHMGVNHRIDALPPSSGAFHIPNFVSGCDGPEVAFLSDAWRISRLVIADRTTPSADWRCIRGLKTES
jgi:hypothetical protein